MSYLSTEICRKIREFFPEVVATLLFQPPTQFFPVSNLLARALFCIYKYLVTFHPAIAFHTLMIPYYIETLERYKDVIGV